VITPDKLGDDEDLAREVLIIGASIAPCIHGFADDSEEQKNAIAILKRVYLEVEDRGTRFAKSERTGTGAVEWVVRSAFDGDPRTALKALCTAASTGANPVGSFPTERPLRNVWPETYS
jgi:hypothetical protein